MSMFRQHQVYAIASAEYFKRQITQPFRCGYGLLQNPPGFLLH